MLQSLTSHRTITAPCECVAERNPPSEVNDEHHLHPLGWGGPDTPENKIVLCPATHRMVTLYMNWCVRKGREPEKGEYGRKMTRYALRIAREGIKRHGGIPSNARPE